MPLPQRGPYEAFEGIYPGRAGKNWGWARFQELQIAILSHWIPSIITLVDALFVLMHPSPRNIRLPFFHQQDKGKNQHHHYREEVERVIK